MLSLLFAIYLAIPSDTPPSCDRSVLNSDEALYQDILLSSEDSSVKLRYLKKFGGCIVSEGVSLVEVRNIPVIETLDCSDPLKDKGSEVFFNKGKLCSRSVQFFPSSTVFTINGSLPVISVNEKWSSVQGRDMTLFFSRTYKFTQFQDAEGRVLAKKEDGFFTDLQGKPVYPYFIYESGTWKSIHPLRELFQLNVKNDGTFTIRIISDSPIPYEREDLIETAGLKASDVIVETPLPSTYFIKGKDLKGVRVPFLSISKNGDGFHGTYIFRLFYDGIGGKASAPVEDDDFSIITKNTAGSKELILTVRTKNLSKEKIDRILAFINREIPSFHITKNDVQ